MRVAYPHFYMLSWCDSSEQGHVHFTLRFNSRSQPICFCPDVLYVTLLVLVYQAGLYGCDIEPP